MNPARLIATGAATTLLALSLACTTDHPSHPTPPPTPSPTTHLPTTPQTRAESFAHQYFAILIKAARSRDTAQLQAISGPDCVVCRQEIDFVSGMKANGQSTDLSEVGVEDVKLVTSTDSTVAALVTTREPAYHVTDSHGQIVKSEPAYRVQFQMGFRFNGEHLSLVYLMDALNRTLA
jgi:hypothetical protein